MSSPFTRDDGDETAVGKIAPSEPSPTGGVTEPAVSAPSSLRSERVAAAIAQIWSQRQGAVIDQIDVIEEAVADLLQGRLEEELRGPAQREAHKLAGSLGTFGFSLGSSIAGEMEAIFARGGAIQSADALRLSELLMQLREEVSGSPSSGPAAASRARPTAPPEGAPGILVIGRDGELTGLLVEEGTARGIHVRSVGNPDAARAALAEAHSDLVLIDLDVVNHAEGLVLIHDLGLERPPIPTMVLAGGRGFADRLEIARLGGRGFLQKPLSAGRVMDAAGELLQRVRSTAPKVLVLDDDPQALSLVAAQLQVEGIHVTALGDPGRFWTTLQELMPDLLILDIDLPGVNGLELCRVMRMDSRWRQVPVLFITSDQSPEVVVEVFAAGADDLVRKSVAGSELVARVRNRLDRVEVYRANAEVDPLTGVATRARASETLDHFVHLAERYREPMSLALIDVDNLQDANQSHGHELGDHILRRLGELLDETFRSEDVVGRWTEDQFILGMYGLHVDDGVQRVAELLERFRSEQFETHMGGTFLTSFSAGVATYPKDGHDLAALCRRAEDALQQAIKTGRQRVLPAGWNAESGKNLESADVVIVEDDDTLAGLLSHTLTTQGYVVHRFTDGQKAAASLAGASPTVQTQVVLLDVELPGLNGLGVLRRLAQSGVLRRSRVIMLTARAAESEVLEAMRLGAFDHVAKPFSLPVLMHRIRRTLRD